MVNEMGTTSLRKAFHSSAPIGVGIASSLASCIGKINPSIIPSSIADDP